KGQAGEMVAVQMADQDRRHGVGIDLPLADRHHRGGAAIDQHVAAGGALEMETGVEAAAAAEGIAGAQKLQAHRAKAPAPGSTLRWGAWCAACRAPRWGGGAG